MFARAQYKLISVVAILSILASLTGACAAKDQTQEISFMVWGGPAELAAYQKLVGTFQNKYPNITVNLFHIPDSGDYKTRLAADMTSGTPADVILLNYREYAVFAQKERLQAIDAYLKSSKLISADDFYSQAMEPYIQQGQQICLPQNISSLVVYYNQSLFEQAGIPLPKTGWNWEDFLAAAQALTQDTNGDGTIDQYGVGIEPSIIRLAPFIWQAGGEIANDNANPTNLLLDAPQDFEAYYFFVELQTTHHVVPSAEMEAAQDSQSRFENGTMGMYFNSRKVVPSFRNAATFEWDVAPLPVKAGAQAVNVLHTDAYCMAAVSKHKDAAWKFIEYANSVEGQTIIASTGRTVPSLKSVAESSAFLDPGQKPANSRLWLDAIPTLRPLPYGPIWSELEKIIGEELERAFYGNVSVNEAVVATMERTQDAIFTK